MSVCKSIIPSWNLSRGNSLPLLQRLKALLINALIALSVTTALSACGGGDSESSDAGMQQDVAIQEDSSGSSVELSANNGAYLTIPSGYVEGGDGIVLGHGFSANETYFLTVTDPAGGVVTETVAIDENGSFQYSLSLVQNGEYLFSATDSSGEEVGSVTASVASLQ